MNVKRLVLDQYRSARGSGFAWNAIDDCLGWAAAVAMELTGRDPIAHIRGRYDSAVGARRVMVEEGWSGLADVARSCFREIPLAEARFGDWAVIANIDGTETIGVVAGAMIAAKTEAGMGQTPRSRATAAFRVE